MNMGMYWPILIIDISNVFYQLCAKSSPENMNPFAVLVISYAVSAVCCAILYTVLNPSGSLVQELKNTNSIPFLIGIALVGLEAGTIYMYKVGWAVNTGYIVHSALIALALLVVGFLVFKEPITWSKVAGIVICMIGLYFINK